MDSPRILPTGKILRRGRRFLAGGHLSKGLGMRNLCISRLELECGLTCTWVWAFQGPPPPKGVAGHRLGAGKGQRTRVEVKLLEVITSTAPSLGEETKAQRGNSNA